MFIVKVLDSIKPAFSYTIHYGCKGDTVIFTNTTKEATRYVWDFGDGYSDTAANPTHVYITQDSFVVKLTAITPKCDDSVKQTIQLIHPVIAAFIASPLIVCQHSPVTFTNTSAGSALNYAWTFGNGATDNSASPVYTYDVAGVYKVRLVANNFIPCYDTAYTTVYVDSITAIGMSASDTVLCRSTYITFTGFYTTIGNTGVTWNFGDGDSIVNINPVQHAFDSTGVFFITVTPHYRVCRDTSISRKVTLLQSPDLYLGNDTTICPGSNPITIGDNRNATNPAASWIWSTGQKTSHITIVSPGSYWAAVYMNGCYASDTIHVVKDCYLNIPNVFSPNADGMNDYFFPRDYLSKGLTAFKMNIYNRWGELIFETTSLEGAGWDGKYNNREQPVGVYVYVIDATFKDGQKEHHQGNVTLIR